MMNPKTSLEIYIHIPFCIRKCRYCDFLSYAEHSGREAYIRALVQEIRYYGGQLRGKYTVQSVFIGGGTPSILSGEELSSIAAALQESFPMDSVQEWTIEANPATFDAARAALWKSLGINRVSMGVQSLDDRILRRLGRIHTAEQASEGYRCLRKAGFENVSLDLMMGLPDQSLSDWMQTLTEVVSWHPEHVSCYSLMVEEGTPFYEEEQRGTLILPEEEEERRMYHEGIAYLKTQGYEQYEISNFSQKGYKSLHNCGYWLRTPYIGMGLGAASLLEETRFRNQDCLAEYIEEAPEQHVQERETLTIQDQMSEYMFLGLRMNQGVGSSEFLSAFGRPVEEVYPEALKKTIREGLLMREGDRYHLTNHGFDLANLVFREFI